jgi:methylated-DNA-[protein]-cysteine S-methyltransferase
MNYIVASTILGPVTIASNEAVVEQVHIEGDKYFTQVPSGWTKAPQDPLLLRAQREIIEYLGGTRAEFSFHVATQGTPFQEKVWNAIKLIPYGSTSTYAAIALAIDMPKAARAVGTAIGRNPVCIVIPCHRVLTSAGLLGGYVAGSERKQQILDLEKA